MRWTTKFLLWVGAGTGVLLTAFVALSALGGNVSETMGAVPFWAGRALALAAFPAGLAVSRDVLPDHTFAWEKPIVMVLLAGALVVSTFVLTNFIGPALQDEPTGVESSALETNHLSFGAMRTHMSSVVRTAQSQPNVRTVDHWILANALVWQYDARVTASILPMLFAWIGVLAGFWTRLTPRAELRQLQYWGLGLFLVMSTYLAGENSYELIVLNAAGPVFFSGLFVLFIPVMLVGGLGWPAGLLIWHEVRQRRGD